MLGSSIWILRRRGATGPRGHNPLYMGRPDDRPWSDRHKAILWAAMVLAAIALGIVAIRGLRSDAKP